jgi:hypothetical protein
MASRCVHSAAVSAIRAESVAVVAPYRADSTVRGGGVCGANAATVGTGGAAVVAAI